MKHNYLIWKRLFLFVTILALANFVYAQDQTVSGTVVSQEDNLPIPGVNIIVKNTTSGMGKPGPDENAGKELP